jgi:hypothetical protein
MEKSIQNNLCKGLRACGVSKELTHQVMDIVIKWHDANGPEWTLKRIKDLRQWYESSLTGDPVPPEWFKHGEDNLPLGVWKSVFKLPIAKALGVLSVGTVFYEKQPSPTQVRKFAKGLAGNGSTHDPQEFEQARKSLFDDIQFVTGNGKRQYIIPSVCWTTGSRIGQMPDLELPTVFDMNGSVPVHNGRSRMHPKDSLGLAYKALEESWDSVPQVTWDFLISQDKLDWLPVINEWRLELDGKHDECVGTIGVVQEPELKARFVANTNRITQKTLDPLKKVLEECTKRNPLSCIYDQNEGMEWVRKHLQEGTSLSGCDLTSASDLLNLESCMDLVEAVYGLRNIKGYLQYRDYYLEVSRSKWYAPFDNSEVKWLQGSPMGTGPSIFYLDLANGACIFAAYVAYCKDLKKQGKPVPSFGPKEAGRTIGDDAIVRTEIAPYYIKAIERLGGEVNKSKTLTSEKVAEFAGRVITPEAVYLKKVKYAEPSDNSFLAMIAQLGPQAKWLLSRDQYKIWNKLKEVPGIVIPGPWTRDSYGLSIADRLEWYLECVQPILDSADAELDKIPLSYILYKAGLAAESAELSIDPDHKIPWPMEESYLDSEVTNAFKTHGDPRLTNGKTLREVLLPKIGHIESFDSWKNRTKHDWDLLGDQSDTQQPVASPAPEVAVENAQEYAPTQRKRVSRHVEHGGMEL